MWRPEKEQRGHAASKQIETKATRQAGKQKLNATHRAKAEEQPENQTRESITKWVQLRKLQKDQQW